MALGTAIVTEMHVANLIGAALASAVTNNVETNIAVDYIANTGSSTLWLPGAVVAA